MSGEDLRNDPNWRSKAPYGLHVDGTPLTKEEYEALKHKPEIIKVKIDAKQVTDLIEEKKELEAERDDYKEKLDLVAAVAFEKKKRELGAPDDITTPEQLEGFEKAINKAKQGGLAQGGTAPMNNAQYGQQNQQGAASINALIDSLNDRCSASNKNLADRQLAIAQREELLKKNFRGQRDAGKPFNYEPKESDKSPLEILREKYKRRRELAKGGEA